MASLSVGRDGSKHIEARVDAEARHKEIADRQFRELQFWLGFIDDLLGCDLRVWNARLVEWFMREVVVGTVMSTWGSALESGAQNGNAHTNLSKVYKARAEARVAIIFLTQ